MTDIVDRLYRLTSGQPTTADGEWLTEQLQQAYIGKNNALSGIHVTCGKHWREQRTEAAYTLAGHLTSVYPSLTGSAIADQIIMYQIAPPTHPETLHLYREYEAVCDVVGFYKQTRLADIATHVVDRSR